MPKKKTRRAVYKRFRKTSKGKLVCSHSGIRHNLGTKTTKQKRRLKKNVIVHSGDAARITKMLPYF